MKKAHVVKGSERATGPGIVSLTEEQLRNYTMIYTNKTQALERRANIAELENIIRSNRISIEEWQTNISHYKAYNADYRNQITAHEDVLASMKEAASSEEIEDLRKQLERLAQLAWVEEVRVGSTSETLEVVTRRDMLKTRLEECMVVNGSDRQMALAMNDPVPVVSMPKLIIRVSLRQIVKNDQTWANNSSVFALSLADLENDCSAHISPAAASINHVKDPRPHWACPRGSGYKKVCLGEYEGDFIEASRKGIPELFEQIAIFLQTSGWAHAYTPKWNWALTLGNPAYTEYTSRFLNKTETLDQVRHNYQRDFKAVNQPDGAVAAETRDSGPRNTDFDNISLTPPF